MRSASPLAFLPPRIAFAAIVASATVATFAAPAFAQETSPRPVLQREAIVSVSGDGEASVAPDMAILTLAVVRNGKTAADALAANSQAMREVLASLKKSGIADRDMQTSNFSIYPQYNHFEPKDGVNKPPEIVGYEVSNTLTLRIRDLAGLGAIIDQSVKLGVNQGGQIIFTNDDPAKTMTEARKAAVAEAVAKAKTLTEAAGVKLGRVLEIRESSRRSMPPQPMMRMAMAKDMANESVPVASGENTYSVTVDVTFALEQ